MKLTDFMAMMEEIAPQTLAEEYDNPGLNIGTTRTEIRKVLVALDCTLTTAREAVELGADLLLTHHPLFFEGVKHMLPDDPETAAAMLLIKHDIAHFSAHTNFDAAKGGVNDCLASLIGLERVAPIPGDELGRMGELIDAKSARDFAKQVARALNTPVQLADAGVPVKRLALVGGAGGSDIYAAKAAGADTFVTGEAKHHQALHAVQMGMNLIVAGHYETECIALAPLIDYLQARSIDVQYTLTHSEKPCLVTVLE